MKNTTMKTLSLFVLGFLLTLAACKKCYVCEGTYVCVRCYKGTDTVGDCNWAGSSVLPDLLSQHKPVGYLCDTTSSYKSSIDLCKDNYPVTKEQLEANGLSCDRKIR